jgi:hypothetical protein
VISNENRPAGRDPGPSQPALETHGTARTDQKWNGNPPQDPRRKPNEKENQANSQSEKGVTQATCVN